MSKSDEKRCDNCGSIHDENDAFCGHCGAAFGNTGSGTANISLLQSASPRRLSQKPLTPNSDELTRSTPVPQFFSQPPSHKIYLAVIVVLVLTLIGASILVGILLRNFNTATPTSTPSTSISKVLYQADWSNGLDGWAGSSDWKAEGGMLVSDGTFQDTNGSVASPTIASPFQVNETSDYAVETRIQQLGGKGCFDAAVIRGHITSDNVQGYRLAIGCVGGVTIYATHGSLLDAIAYASFDPGKNWHIYRLEAKANTIRAFIDGMQVLGVNDNTYLSGGITGIKSQATQITLSSFKIIAL